MAAGGSPEVTLVSINWTTSPRTGNQLVTVHHIFHLSAKEAKRTRTERFAELHTDALKLFPPLSLPLCSKENYIKAEEHRNRKRWHLLLRSGPGNTESVASSAL
ncbi:hypothetical protein AMECASPLE_002943 [Ameca splendens]|uniref:Uncharacterized protein n=1 Tax=Ameca splendens TaxID=208324 RepID=A0ABV0XMI9_9TELE